MKKIYNIKVSTLIMISLPIISVLIGYFGVKLYLLSNDNYNEEIDSNIPGVEEIIENNNESLDDSLENEEESNANLNENETGETEKSVTESIGPINYYSIQVGSFSSEENANDFRNELEDNGLFAYNLADSNYKVFVSASYNKDMLEEELAVVKETSPDAFIKSISLESKNFSYKINETDYFKEVSKTIENQLNNINASLDIQKLKEQLIEIEKNTTKFKEANKANEDLGNHVTAYVNNIRKEIDLIDTVNEESIQAFFESNISFFIKHFR